MKASSNQNNNSTNTNSHNKKGIQCCPFPRSQECSWEPEEVATRFTTLLPSSSSNETKNHPAEIDSSSSSSGLSKEQHLHGWSNHQVPIVRALYGSNEIHTDDDDDDDNDSESSNNNNTILVRYKKRLKKTCTEKLPKCVVPILSSLVEQCKEPLIIMLLCTSTISVLLGNAADAISISVALSIVALVAAIQEYRSECALEKLTNLNPKTCTVIRNGGTIVTNFLAKELVLGDLLLLSTGDRIPADCRMVHAVNLLVDESTLTGENHPVMKTSHALFFDTTVTTTINNDNNNNDNDNDNNNTIPITAQENIVFNGTLINSGHGKAIVIAIGKNTEFGNIANELQDIQNGSCSSGGTPKKSPLQLRIDELSNFIASASTLFIALMSMVGYVCYHRPILETITIAVSLAVAAIPEGLPICVTVTLVLGILRMAKNCNAIVKKLPIVEKLGCTTTICTDKTGTLTQNEMTVRKVYTVAHGYNTLSGLGYHPNNGTLRFNPTQKNTTTHTQIPPTIPTQNLSDNHNNNHSSMNNNNPQDSQKRTILIAGGGISNTTTRTTTTTTTDAIDSLVVSNFPALQAFFYSSCLCNNATLVVNNNKNEGIINDDNNNNNNSEPSNSSSDLEFSGQPTELALLVASMKASKMNNTHNSYHDIRSKYTRIEEISFTSTRKRMEVRARPINCHGTHEECVAFQNAINDYNNNNNNNNNNTTAKKVNTTISDNDESNNSLYFAKGMPETIINDCSYYVTEMGTIASLSKEQKASLLDESKNMSSADGLRVLGVAFGASLNKHNEEKHRNNSSSGAGGGLIFTGLVGMEDPIKIGVKESIQELRKSGIQVIMVTGDSKEIAQNVAYKCGILDNKEQYNYHGYENNNEGNIASGSSSDHYNTIESVGQGSNSSNKLKNRTRSAPSSCNSINTVGSSLSMDIEYGSLISNSMSGTELEYILHNNNKSSNDNISHSNDNDEDVSELASRIKKTSIFYRVAPQQKLAIVRALQQIPNEIVAMTGDGVNDATALKGADIGISMGIGGTDVAKEASDVVLADDNFATIGKAIQEGKGIFFNIRNFLSFQLSTSFAALGIECLATMLYPHLKSSPLNAMQILWINIIMDGPPAQSLGVEPVDEYIINSKPRKAADPIITKPLLLRAISSAALVVFCTLSVFSKELHDNDANETVVSRRDTTMTFMTFVNCDLFNAYVCRSADKCFYELSNPFVHNKAFLYAIVGSVIGQLLVVYFKPLQDVFQTEALSARDMLYIVTLSSSMLWFDTLRKKYFHSWFSDVPKKNNSTISDTNRTKNSDGGGGSGGTNHNKKARRGRNKNNIIQRNVSNLSLISYNNNNNNNNNNNHTGVINDDQQQNNVNDNENHSSSFLKSVLSPYYNIKGMVNKNK